jgi:NAD dependent epimerase/dehydratase family enzyme
MGRPSYMPVPGFALKWVIGEVATIVLDGQKVLPKKLEELGFSFQFAELEQALRNVIR